MVAEQRSAAVALPERTERRAPGRLDRRNDGRPRYRRGDGRAALLFLLPGLALVAFTFLYPVYALVRMSLVQSLGSLSMYVGLDNYRLVLTDPLFLTSVRNNLLLMACVPVMVVVALVFALLLFEQRRSAPVYRFLLFVPYIVSIPVSGIAFSQILTRNGALNQMLGAAGLGFLQRDWLGDPSLALVSIGAVMVWRECVLGIVLFVARLLSLSTEPLEAAMVDGATRWRAHRDVTLPQLMPIVGFFAITAVITVAVWTFSYVFVITNGGPGNATMTADLYIYQNAFTTAQMNLAAAAATVVLVAAIVVAGTSLLAPRLLAKGAPR